MPILRRNSSKEKLSIDCVGHVGLSNQGNTCFMNGGLQAMISSRVLVSAILEAHEKKKSDGLMVKAFLDFIKASCRSDVYKPRLLKEAAGKRNPRFCGFAQEDSFEFIQTVLDGLEEETNLADKKIKTGNVDNTGLSFEAAQKAFREDHYKRLDTPIARCTYSEIVREITCRGCSHSQYSFEYTQMLLLDLPKDDRPEVTLEELLFQKKTSEVEGYRCSGCKQCVTVTLTERLVTPAECLIIVFKRYEEGNDSWGRPSSHFRKNNISVNYPLHLELSIPTAKHPAVQSAAWIGQSVVDTQAYKYEFRGASIQSERYCGGHYTAVGFGCDGCFYVCNDSQVIHQDNGPGKPKYQLPQGAYIVIYDRSA